MKTPRPALTSCALLRALRRWWARLAGPDEDEARIFAFKVL